jgi:hypothetical protein
MGECRDLKGSAVHSVVLAIRLVGATASNREQLVAGILADSKVTKALHEAFLQQANHLTQARLTGKTPDASVAKALLQPLANAAGPAALREVRNQPEYQEAERGLRDLKCAFDATPVGVFIDENQTVLIIAGVVLGAAGAVTMYHARAGDVPARALTEITNRAASSIDIGQVKLGISGVEFKPSTQSVKGTARLELGSLKLHGVKTAFELKSAVEAGKLQALSVSDTVVVPLAPSTQLKARAGVGVMDMRPTYDLALTVKHSPTSGLTLDVTAYAKGLGQAQTLGGKATAGYQMTGNSLFGPRSTTHIGATGKVEATRPGGNTPFRTESSLFLGLTATFD